MIGEPGTNSLRAVRRPGTEYGVSLRKRRRWFEGEGDGSGSGEQQGEGQGSGTGTSAGQSGGQNQPETFTFTSAQLAERINRAEQAILNKVYADLGVKNTEEAKTVLEAHRARVEGEKTELEKLQGNLTKVEQEKKDAENRLAQMEQERRLEKRNNAILAALQDAEHPEDVLIWLTANTKSEVEAVMGEDGTIDEKKIKSLVEKVEKERPGYFKKSSPGSLSNRGGKTPQPGKEAAKAAQEAHFRRARRNI